MRLTQRQRDTDRLGMLVFLASETMLFGALLSVALALQLRHPAEVAAASARLNLWLGGANTAILLTSSLVVAIGVTVKRRTAACFATAALLGAAFLAIKGIEYRDEWREGLMPGTTTAHFATPAQALFMRLYMIATLLHALHLVIGIALLGFLAWRLRGKKPPSPVMVSNAGLYWHLVDVVWVFLYPLLYLSRV